MKNNRFAAIPLRLRLTQSGTICATILTVPIKCANKHQLSENEGSLAFPHFQMVPCVIARPDPVVSKAEAFRYTTSLINKLPRSKLLL